MAESRERKVERRVGAIHAVVALLVLLVGMMGAALRYAAMAGGWQQRIVDHMDAMDKAIQANSDAMKVLYKNRHQDRMELMKIEQRLRIPIEDTGDPK